MTTAYEGPSRSDNRSQSGDFADSVTAVQDAGVEAGALNWRELLDCGDGVIGVAAFEFGENDHCLRRAKPFGQPKPKR